MVASICLFELEGATQKKSAGEARYIKWTSGLMPTRGVTKWGRRVDLLTCGKGNTPGVGEGAGRPRMVWVFRLGKGCQEK